MTTRVTGILAGAALLLTHGLGAAGCGSSDETKPPVIEAPEVTCEMSEDPNIDEQVVTEVSVAVSDPDRDLQTDDGQLHGTFNGLPISLSDPNADGRFNWEPGDQRDRIICQGQLILTVTARDGAGHETNFSQDIVKN